MGSLRLRGILFWACLLLLCHPPPAGSQEVRLALEAPEMRAHAAWIQPFAVGRSVQGRPLEGVHIGASGPALVVLGCIHGNEANTETLVRRLQEAFVFNPEPVQHAALYFVPLVNPDGRAAGTRSNARGVDLNRNWPTDDWKADAATSGGIREGAGGSEPASEPEVAALVEWIEDGLVPRHEPLWLLSYHSAYPPRGAVQGGYRVQGRPTPGAESLAQLVADRIGSTYIEAWPGEHALTGELIHWCAVRGITAADIELPSREEPERIQTAGGRPLVEVHYAMLLELLRILASEVAR